MDTSGATSNWNNAMVDSIVYADTPTIAPQISLPLENVKLPDFEDVTETHPPTTMQKPQTHIGPYTIFVVFGIVVMVVARILQICYARKIRGRRRGESEELEGDAQFFYNRTPIYFPLGEPGPIHMEMEDRVELYQRTFDINKNSHTLTQEDFESNNCEANNEQNDLESGRANGYYEEEEEESPWIYLPLKDYSEKKEEQEDDNKEQSTVEAHIDATDIQAKRSSDLVSENDSPTKTRVPGTCIICFEDFCIGENVVYSENSSRCKHVFHEECMVRFLASNSMRKKPFTRNHNNTALEYNPSTSYSENPCPACRHPFCTVSKQSLLLSVLLKSVRTAIQEISGETENGTNFMPQTDNSNNNEDSNSAVTTDDDSTTFEDAIHEGDDDSEENGEVVVRLPSSDQTADIPNEDV